MLFLLLGKSCVMDFAGLNVFKIILVQIPRFLRTMEVYCTAKLHFTAKATEYKLYVNHLALNKHLLSFTFKLRYQHHRSRLTIFDRVKRRIHSLWRLPPKSVLHLYNKLTT